MDTIVTFKSVHHALNCESKLLEDSIQLTLITTPRSVTSNCGFSVEMEECDSEAAKKILIERTINYEGLYEKSIRDGVKYYAKKD